MKTQLKKVINHLFERQVIALKRVRLNYINRRGIKSYGQEGEDRVLASLLFRVHGSRLPQNGFYVDVGAHDPFRFSNTFFFYKLGWSGMNIDATPGSMRQFATHRPRDLNLELGIGKESTAVTFYLFNEPALNTMDFELAKARCIGSWRITAEVKVDVLPLREVLSRYVADGRRIDFISIDVEGRDMDVLQSNDWLRFRPLIVAVEIFGKSIADAEKGG